MGFPQRTKIVHPSRFLSPAFGGPCGIRTFWLYSACEVTSSLWDTLIDRLTYSLTKFSIDAWKRTYSLRLATAPSFTPTSYSGNFDFFNWTNNDNVSANPSPPQSLHTIVWPGGNFNSSLTTESDSNMSRVNQTSQSSEHRTKDVCSRCLKRIVFTSPLIIQTIYCLLRSSAVSLNWKFMLNPPLLARDHVSSTLYWSRV